jgi:hypothetical protein
MKEIAALFICHSVEEEKLINNRFVVSISGTIHAGRVKPLFLEKYHCKP